MPVLEIFHLHPLGWENDPEEEKIPLSTLDYLPPFLYNNYVLFFKLDDEGKSRMAVLLRVGLERTLSQARHLCGTIEMDAGTGGHAFVRRRESTVEFHVQWLDSSPCSHYPSFSELEAHNFSSRAMGDLGLWSVAPMTHGLKPEADIDNSPAVSAFKANFVRGGLVFNMHVHHCSNDIMGWASFTHQLAENCRAIYLNDETAFPSWDPACLDRSRFTSREPIPEAAKIDDAPGPGEPHPGLLPIIPLLFHLPKSKAARLKALATPPPDATTGPSWISTFDAFSAFIWRTLLRIRSGVFQAEASPTLLWMAPINLRRRLGTDGATATNGQLCPPRAQGNVFTLARVSTTAASVGSGPLREVAALVRSAVAAASTPKALEERIRAAAAVRDKTALSFRADRLSPLTLVVTDWRAADVTAADFGPPAGGAPVAFRHVSDDVTRCVVQVYPPRRGDGEDEGCEFVITFESSLAQALIEDTEWSEFFEYRGVM
ncbi:transferase family-domain-containing protein [Podospora didyma]|uniref:Transferase family-domain-containing protein n=1 Tax=Podospora didyma TaxID=330526 RepID=A0AAE0N337_9PEZI|nr:transferase family-domain-containing protein [Podospora didyma]